MTDERTFSVVNVLTDTEDTFTYLAENGLTVTLSGRDFVSNGRIIDDGTITSATFESPEGDVVASLTGISVDVEKLFVDLAHFSTAAFWDDALEGTSIINAQNLNLDQAGAFGSVVVGDHTEALVDADDNPLDFDFGGADIITIGNGVFKAVGDAETVIGVPFAPGVDDMPTYTAGRDQILATESFGEQRLVGDVDVLDKVVHLIAGDDLIEFDFNDSDAIAIGDVNKTQNFVGVGGSFIEAGDDEMNAKGDSRGTIVGDLGTAFDNTTVEGGNDSINGGDGDEIIVGDVLEHTRDGGEVIGGDDSIEGGGGDDLIVGDILDNGVIAPGFAALADEGPALTVGQDTINGGAGSDSILGDTGTDAGTAAGDGGDVIKGGGGRDFADGQFGDDNVAGNGGRDNVSGGVGDDTVNGGNGIDEVFGDDGNDIVRGGGGNDLVDGGDGADRVSGDNGNDTIVTGRGADTVLFAPGDGIDRVLDFREVDVLDLRGFGFANFAEVQALARPTDGGNDTRIDFADGERITLEDFAFSSFSADDVLI